MCVCVSNNITLVCTDVKIKHGLIDWRPCVCQCERAAEDEGGPDEGAGRAAAGDQPSAGGAQRVQHAAGRAGAEVQGRR